MRYGWDIRTIGEVCDVQGGATPKRTEKVFWENGTFPWFTVDDIRVQGRRIVDTQQKITETAWKRMRVFPKETVLLCCTASLGEYAITSIPITSNQQFNGLTIKNKEQLLPSYLFYFCATLKPVLQKLSGKATIDFVSGEKVRQIPIPFPLSLTEQQRIVDVLDKEFTKIDALKAKTEKSLQAAKDLFQVSLKKELEPKEGWSNARMDEICHITADLIDPTQPEYLHQIHIGGANIETETGVLLDLKTAEEEKLISGKFPFDETMVLYSKIRPYLKKICCPNFQGICSADIYPLKPLPGIDRTYLYYILLSQDFTDYAILGSARAGMPKVNRPYLFAYSCSIPGYEEQCSIANRLDIIRKKTIILQENYGKTLALCDDLKQALLRKAFNGEL